jgi:hypothetical protein
MTDHRAEAETALAEAAKIVDSDSTSYSDDLFGWALIGHALLGLISTPPGSPATPTESQRCSARHDGLRCVFWSGHKDPHRATWRDEPEQETTDADA